MESNPYESASSFGAFLERGRRPGGTIRVAFSHSFLILRPVERVITKLILGVVFGAVFALSSGCKKWNEPIRTDHSSGTIEVDEARLASRYGGRVEEILAREGDGVTTGQLLVRLSAAELTSRHAQTAALLEESKAGARKEELAAAMNEWQAVVAELEFAKSEQKRITELFEGKAVPESERDRAVTRVASLEKSVAAAKSRYDLLVAGTRRERVAQVEAQLAEIETQMREMQILAPTNAVLEVLHVKVGDVPGPNQPVATLLLTNHLWVRVYVPEPWLGFIKLGQQVRVKVDSFPDRDFPGEVEQIARAAEFTPRNVQTVSDRVKQVFGVKVRLPTASEFLRAGMAADVYFPDTPKAE
jgi:multidrug resistance efflux pump